MSLKCKTNEPCPKCGTDVVDFFTEHLPSGKVIGYIICVECDRTIVLNDLHFSFEGSGFADIEGIDVEKIETELVSAAIRYDAPVVDPELIEAVKLFAKKLEAASKDGLKMKVKFDDSTFRPPPKSSSPPGPDGFKGGVIKGKGGQSFQYRRRDR